MLEEHGSRRKTQDYYEIMWEREASLDDCIQQEWAQETTRGDLGTVNTALKGAMRSLKQWSSEKFGSVCKKLELLRSRLAELQAAGTDD